MWLMRDLYYNFIKPYETLESKTPSEMACITIEGDNKWLTLMRKSIKYQKLSITE
jgi:hypothetical protein